MQGRRRCVTAEARADLAAALGLDVLISESINFIRRYLAAPGQVGAVAPSSPWLSAALTAPFAGRTTPAAVLEIGAGTGPVTRRLGTLIGSEDRIDICEMDDRFVKLLEQTVETTESLKRARAEGRLRILHHPVQELAAENAYDFVISGLPMNAFAPQMVASILSTIRTAIRPGGVFSYFEYIGARRLLSVSPDARARRRIRAVSNVLDPHIRQHQVARRSVLANIPPAHARHWVFSDSKESVAEGDELQVTSAS